jgi:hypothetical protein
MIRYSILSVIYFLLLGSAFAAAEKNLAPSSPFAENCEERFSEPQWMEAGPAQFHIS